MHSLRRTARPPCSASSLTELSRVHPEATQRLDHIDGIIIDICRRARDAAEAASKDLGDPAILKAFKLDKLYASRSGGAKKDAAAPGTTAPSPAAAPGNKTP